MSKKSPKVDAFVGRATRWQSETKKLRSILLDAGLDEELKWGKPCYTFQGKNVAIIQGFKEHCSLMFFKGALLKDPKGHLLSQGPHSQAAKRLQLTSVRQVAAIEPALRSFVAQAIRLEKAGAKVDFKAKLELRFPEELTRRLAVDPALAAAFEALTPGRRRVYVMHFTDAKQSATRVARIERCAKRIMAGRGLNDP